MRVELKKFCKRSNSREITAKFQKLPALTMKNLTGAVIQKVSRMKKYL